MYKTLTFEMSNRLVEYYVSACFPIYGILLSRVGPEFAEQNTPLQSLHNWHNPAQFPFCASRCQQAAVITEVKKSQIGGHIGLLTSEVYGT